MNELKVYTLDEIAAMLSVTRRTLYTWIKDGHLKAVKIGKYWRVSEEAYKDLLSKGTRD